MSNLRWILALLVCSAVACGSDDERTKGGDDDDSSDGVDPPKTALTGVAGVWITKVSSYQGLELPLMLNGAPATTGTVPIVAGRNAMFRLFLGTDPAYTGGPVTARVWIGDAPQPIEVTAQSVFASNDGDLNSTINVDVPGALLVADTKYRVEIGQIVQGDAAAPPFAYPPNGAADPIFVTQVGPALKVQLVPIIYGADGSNRVPDTSEGHLAKIRDLFFATYPAPAIDLTVHAPVQHNQTVSAFGNGWGQLLQKIADLRQSEGTPPDVYFHGIFDPDSSFNAFCGGGCVTGLGMQGQPGDTYTRASIGVGFYEVASETAIHEVGHAHGRGHTNCDTFDGVDPAFPHPNGAIGVWGFDLVTRQLFPPETADFMGYCKPIWISDYTFNGLMQRIKMVNGASFVFPEAVLDRLYERVLVLASGEVQVLPEIQMHLPPMGEAVRVRIGPVVTEAQRYTFDHLDDQMIVWPATGKLRTAGSIEIDAARFVIP